MKTEDPSTKKPMEYNRVIINVPKGLLKDFDKVCSLQYYSRVEAIKESMRMFVDNSMPDNYLSPEESTEQFTAMWDGLMEATMNLQQNPKYKALQKQNLLTNQGSVSGPQGIPVPPGVSTITQPTVETIRAELERQKLLEKKKKK